MPRQIITLFSGGGLFTQGAVLAGLHPVGAVEWDANIAGVYRENFGDRVTVAPIENVDPNQWGLAPGELDILQASPSCKNLSVANQKSGGESYSDITAALGIIRHLVRLQPKCFVLEQVWGYNETISLKMILSTLKALKYHYTISKINAADYGTPQTRIRLFVIAVKRSIGFAELPPPTHAEKPTNQLSFLEEPKQKWVSWFDACKDLLDNLPTSQLAKWQVERLAKLGDKFDLENCFLIQDSSLSEKGDLPQRGKSPSKTLTSTHYLAKALLIQRDGTPNDKLIIKESRSPAPTLRTLDGTRTHRQFDALLITATPDRYPPSSDATIGRLSGVDRVQYFLSKGRVVTLGERCLARLQGLPDSYKLPAKRSLACTVIGNGVAVPVARAICSHLLKTLDTCA